METATYEIPWAARDAARLMDEAGIDAGYVATGWGRDEPYVRALLAGNPEAEPDEFEALRYQVKRLASTMPRATEEPNPFPDWGDLAAAVIAGGAPPRAAKRRGAALAFGAVRGDRQMNVRAGGLLSGAAAEVSANV